MHVSTENIEPKLREKWGKTAVVFAGARDHYQVAVALSEAGCLSRLVSELYLPAMPAAIRAAIAVFDRKGRRSARMRMDLPPEDVMISWSAFVASLCNRVFPTAGFGRWKDAALGRACGEYAARHRVPVLAYSYYASYAFERMPAGLPRGIFQVHPHPAAVREILESEMKLCPEATGSLQQENEMRFPAEVLRRLSDEALMADFAITPSSYAKTTLISAGVPAERIAVVPYGIDSSVFKPKHFGAHRDRPLRVIFIGSLVQRKGLSYLLAAARQMAGESVEFVLAGRGAIDRPLLSKYADVPFRVLWNAPRAELVREMQAADIFVFPSLVESFAHVILEAMAVGLPVVTTTHTAGPDLIEEGKTGFVGPVRDVTFLVEKIRWFLHHRREMVEMGKACQAAAAEYTWARFRQGVRDALARFAV